MRRSRGMTDIFARFFDPRMPIFFILGGLLLALMGDSAYGLLVLWWGPSVWALLGVLLGSFVLLGLVVVGIYAVLRVGRLPPVVLGPEEKAKERRGLVLFLSKGEGKADEEALRFHSSTLEYAWFIVTDAVWEEGKAHRLIGACRERDVGVKPLNLRRPRDAGESYHLVEQALAEAEEQGLGPGSLYVDITGCLRPAAVGATMACLKARHDIEYVLARYNKDGQVIPETSQVMEVAVRPAGQEVEGEMR